MANCNAVKIRKSKDAKPTAGNLAHNCAMTKATYWLHDGDNLMQSHSYSNRAVLNEDWKKWENEAKERYKSNPNNKRALKSNAVIIEEGMIIIGTDVEASNEDIRNIVNDFIEKFEKDNNTKIRHWSYHNHEGHVNDSGEESINRHIHFLFDNVSNDGVMVRRNWKRNYFHQLQDDILKVSKKHIPNIERAKRSTYETVEIEGRQVKINTRKSVHHRKWRADKEKEAIQNKSTAQNEQEDNKNATQKDLKEEIFNVREKLKQANALREDYAKLEELNRTLKQQVKDKDLTIGELKKQIDLFKEIFYSKNEEISILKDTNATLEQENKESKSNIEQSLKKIENLEDENRTLKEEISTLYQENRTLKKFANAVKKIVSEKLTNSPIHNLEDVLRKIKEYFNIKDIEPVYEVEQKEDAEHVKLALLHEELSNIETQHKGDAKSVACFIQDAYSEGYTSLKELKNGDMCIVNETIDQKYILREEKFAEYADLYIKAQSKLEEVYSKMQGSEKESNVKTEDQAKSKVRKSR